MTRLPVRASESDYETWARTEVTRWQAAMLRPAGYFARIARRLQTRINGIIPDKVHAAVTLVIQGLTRTILTGSNLTTATPLRGLSLAERDARARELISRYRAISAVEGGVTGAGGFWLALADFPALLVLKIKLLFDLAATYGHDTTRF